MQRPSTWPAAFSHRLAPPSRWLVEVLRHGSPYPRLSRTRLKRERASAAKRYSLWRYLWSDSNYPPLVPEETLKDFFCLHRLWSQEPLATRWLMAQFLTQLLKLKLTDLWHQLTIEMEAFVRLQVVREASRNVRTRNSHLTPTHAVFHMPTWATCIRCMPNLYVVWILLKKYSRGQLTTLLQQPGFLLQYDLSVPRVEVKGGSSIAWCHSTTHWLSHRLDMRMLGKCSLPQEALCRLTSDELEGWSWLWPKLTRAQKYVWIWTFYHLPWCRLDLLFQRVHAIQELVVSFVRTHWMLSSTRKAHEVVHLLMARTPNRPKALWLGLGTLCARIYPRGLALAQLTSLSHDRQPYTAMFKLIDENQTHCAEAVFCYQQLLCDQGYLWPTWDDALEPYSMWRLVTSSLVHPQLRHWLWLQLRDNFPRVSSHQILSWPVHTPWIKKLTIRWSVMPKPRLPWPLSPAPRPDTPVCAFWIDRFTGKVTNHCMTPRTTTSLRAQSVTQRTPVRRTLPEDSPQNPPNVEFGFLNEASVGHAVSQEVLQVAWDHALRQGLVQELEEGRGLHFTSRGDLQTQPTPFWLGWLTAAALSHGLTLPYPLHKTFWMMLGCQSSAALKELTQNLRSRWPEPDCVSLFENDNDNDRKRGSPDLTAWLPHPMLCSQFLQGFRKVSLPYMDGGHLWAEGPLWFHPPDDAELGAPPAGVWHRKHPKDDLVVEYVKTLNPTRLGQFLALVTGKPRWPRLVAGEPPLAVKWLSPEERRHMPLLAQNCFHMLLLTNTHETVQDVAQELQHYYSYETTFGDEV